MGCSKSGVNNSVAPCDPGISYSATIKQIFASNCNIPGCHDDVVIYSLSSYQTVHDVAQLIKNAITSGRMPKDRTLSSIDKNAIVCWIDSGVKNN